MLELPILKPFQTKITHDIPLINAQSQNDSIEKIIEHSYFPSLPVGPIELTMLAKGIVRVYANPYALSLNARTHLEKIDGKFWITDLNAWFHKRDSRGEMKVLQEIDHIEGKVLNSLAIFEEKTVIYAAEMDAYQKNALMKGRKRKKLPFPIEPNLKLKLIPEQKQAVHWYLTMSLSDRFLHERILEFDTYSPQEKNLTLNDAYFQIVKGKQGEYVQAIVRGEQPTITLLNYFVHLFQHYSPNEPYTLEFAKKMNMISTNDPTTPKPIIDTLNRGLMSKFFPKQYR